MELQNIKNRGGRIINTGTPWHKEDCISIMPNVRKYDCYQINLITRDKLEQIRGSMSPSLFCANYELKHIADEDCLFSNPTFTKDNDLILGGIAHIDASYGGTDGTEVYDKEQTFYYIVTDNKLISDVYKIINPRPHKMWRETQNNSIKLKGDKFGFIPFFRLDNNWDLIPFKLVTEI